MLVRSPFECLNYELLIWRFYAIFNLETKSKWKQTLFKAYAYAFKFWFCYVGFILHFSSVYYAESMKAAAETLYVCISYGNAVIKIMIADLNRQNLLRLYNKIDSERFKAQNEDEFK